MSQNAPSHRRILPRFAQSRTGKPGGPVAAKKRFSFWIESNGAAHENPEREGSDYRHLWQELKAVDIGELAFMWVRGNAVDVGNVVEGRMKDAASHPLYLVLKLNTFTTNETNDMVLVDASRFLKSGALPPARTCGSWDCRMPWSRAGCRAQGGQWQ